MLIVDPATGAMYKLPERVDMALADPTPNNDDVTLSINSIDLLTDAERAALIQLTER